MQPIALVLPPLPRLKIVDVGAARGPDGTAYDRLMKAFPCDIVGFEPDEGACEKLNVLKIPGHLYLPHAIADGARRVFHECHAPECSSLLEPNAVLAGKFQHLGEVMRSVGRRMVETKRLDDVPETLGADFLKLDVQGGELLVLQGALDRLADVLVIHTEIEFLPLYKDQPLFADIDSFLRGRGFSFHTMSAFGRAFKPMVINNDMSAALNQLIWGDAVYVRDFMDFSDLPPEALLKIAAILHVNYQSFDLAACALGAHDQQMGNGGLQLRYLESLSKN